MDTHKAPRSPDAGTGYERNPSTYNATLTEVGRSTPMGELMRRYWHPVAVSSDANATPKEVRLLGEDLVLFRDKAGRPGLVYARCVHRGTTLYNGKVEERGIRCCYHGWLFDIEGNCLEQPCEPDGGRNRERTRQPWYPVQERYGLIFAYMGPPAKKPMLPRYEALELLDDGEFIDAGENCVATGGAIVVPCNWLQHWENVMDSYHVPILHGTFSGTQIVELMNKIPQVEWDYTERGVRAVTERTLENGKILRRVTEVAAPTLRLVPDPFINETRPNRALQTLTWTVPIDDTHYRLYSAGRVKAKNAFQARGEGVPDTLLRWKRMSREERREVPGDYEAQVGQGPITFHSEEHLTGSDQGVVMCRRVLQRQLDAIARGEDPVGVSFDENSPLVSFEAGNHIFDPST